ncbi:MAG: helix-turn-helix transcriptional regulator [Spirochaetes bacterium]|nr:helix-turn-helix transcriptional regulator [Spirochaetota bacterium]
MCDLAKNKFPSGRTPRFLQPCILLLLSQKKSYGYKLIDNLKKEGFIETTPDPGIVYRILRKFEKEGFVKSNWIENDKGPAKRIYSLTQSGKSTLKEWSKAIQVKVANLNKFLEEYKKISAT